MAIFEPDPYEILGILHTAKPKDIILAQTKAMQHGLHDRSTITQAMQDLTDNDKRTIVDVLRVGEAPTDFTLQLPKSDIHALHQMLAEDQPELPPKMLVPWKMLQSTELRFEKCPFEPVLPLVMPTNLNDDEPNPFFRT